MSRSGQIKKDETAGGYYFVVDVAAAGEPRKQLKRRFRTYKEARAGLTKVLGDLDGGSYVKPQRQTFGEYVELWLQGVRLEVRPSTAKSYERNLRLHALPALGERPLQAIRPGELRALYAQLLVDGKLDGQRQSVGGLSRRSVAYLHTIIGSVLRTAVDDGLLQSSPAAKIRPPSSTAEGQDHTSIVTWPREVLARFLAESTEHRQWPAWVLLATTGMRRGEALGSRGNRSTSTPAVCRYGGRWSTSTGTSRCGLTPNAPRATGAVPRSRHGGGAASAPGHAGRGAAPRRARLRRLWLGVRDAGRPAVAPGAVLPDVPSAGAPASPAADSGARSAAHLGDAGA